MTDTSSTTEIAARPWARTINGRPTIGGFAERTRRTDMRDIAMFTEMTGDRNPLHYDAALAAGSPFGGLIVQGGVTSGLLNAVVAEDLPGPGTVFLGVEWRFLKAVHVGEEITARVEVVTVRDDKPICTMATSVRNARGGFAFPAAPSPTQCRCWREVQAKQQLFCTESSARKSHLLRGPIPPAFHPFRFGKSTDRNVRFQGAALLN